MLNAITLEIILYLSVQRDANRSTVGVARSTHANFHALVGVGVAGAIE